MKLGSLNADNGRKMPKISNKLESYEKCRCNCDKLSYSALEYSVIGCIPNILQNN